MKYPVLITILSTLLALSSTSLHSASEGKHLFILSDQSNMARLDPAVSFIPAVEAEFGKEQVIVVHDAVGGSPIAMWYRGGQAAGVKKEQVGSFYDRLMEKVNVATQGQPLASVTFVWMQGERDLHEKVMNGDVYADYLRGLMAQLSADMGRKDINFVIGRLSDFGQNSPKGKKYPDWMKVRAAQVSVAEENPRYAWVDTDDLNNKGNSDDLHYLPDTYPILGQRFADKAIELIKQATP